MKRIPSELDRLMWTIAEGSDSSAIDEFGARYPELRSELAMRVLMVRELRASRPPRSERPPQFAPPLTPKRSGHSWRPLSVATGALALLAVGFASYSVVSNLSRHETSRLAGEPAMTVKSGRDEAIVERSAPAAAMSSSAKADASVPSPQSAPENVPAPTVSIEFEDEPIAVALGRLANAARLRLQIAPGFPSTKVTASYEASEGLTILQDLAARYRFTVFDQGDGSLLVIPAVDPSAASDGREAAGLETADR